MAWIYLAESEESPLPWLPGCDRSPIVKTTDTLNLSSYPEWLNLSYHLPLSGTMLEPWTDHPSLKLTSFPEDSLARISALLDLERAWKVSEAGFIGKCIGSLANLNPDSSFWKTCLSSLQEVVARWLNHLPQSGMTVDGQFCQPLQLEQPTLENVGSYWPTITARDWRNTRGRSRGESSGKDIIHFLSLFHQGKPVQLKPSWTEQYMGYPTGHTELNALVTRWYRSRRGRRSCA